MRGQPTDASTRAQSTHGRQQELRQLTDVSKCYLNPRTSAKVTSTQREDGCIKIDGIYREHMAALRQKTTA